MEELLYQIVFVVFLTRRTGIKYKKLGGFLPYVIWKQHHPRPALEFTLNPKHRDQSSAVLLWGTSSFITESEKLLHFKELCEEASWIFFNLIKFLHLPPASMSEQLI